MTRTLEGRVAIVTGAGSFHGDETLPKPGQGSAVAAKLASLGASVVLADRHGDAAERRAKAIREDGGTAVAVQVDVGDEDDVRRMVATAVAEFGRLDFLHNNAADLEALFDPGDPEITRMQTETWHLVFRTLVLGTMLGCKHAIPAMVETGGGSIVCTSSTSGEMGELNLTVYGAAKAAVNQVVRSVSTQYGKQGIRCNAIAPGLILSPPSLAIGEELITEYTRHCDTPYVGEPSDIAEVVAFLASDAARFISGQVIRVDGGFAQQSPLAADSRASGQVAGSN
jgi:NAD(P)-dependent dehydrogenase (short-subunit alcohol dehydrogenase family)